MARTKYKYKLGTTVRTNCGLIGKVIHRFSRVYPENPCYILDIAKKIFYKRGVYTNTLVFAEWYLDKK